MFQAEFSLGSPASSGRRRRTQAREGMVLQTPLSSGSEPGQDLGSVASPPRPASPYIRTPPALIWCLNIVPGPQSALINEQMDDRMGGRSLLLSGTSGSPIVISNNLHQVSTNDPSRRNKIVHLIECLLHLQLKLILIWNDTLCATPPPQKKWGARTEQTIWERTLVP